MSERNAAADVSVIRKAIDKIGDSLRDQGAAIDNEESTKTTLILPFLRDVLGYNVENPFEVKPEYTADIGGNKGEKVDYAICNDDSEQTPRILIECKKLGADLTQDNARQLWRYFSVLSSARFGILTNGRFWQLYTDMDHDNMMDDEPYAILDVLSPDHDAIVLLQDMEKEGFDSGKAREDAERYHKMRLIRQRLDNELSEPSRDFVRLLTEELVQGKFTHKVETEYRPLVEDAVKEYINQRIKSRLEKAAMDEENSDSRQRGAEESDDAAAVGTGTTELGEAEQEQPERKHRRHSSVKMQDLVNAGLLHDGDKLIPVSGQYQDVVATVRGDGKIEIEGQWYKSPSGAAESVTDHSEDGWKFWELRDGRTLDDLRDAYGRGYSVHD